MDWIQQTRLSVLLTKRLGKPVSAEVHPGQPFALDILDALVLLARDRDTAFLQHMKHGVFLGVDGPKDLGAYEQLSATHGADCHAMVKLIELWRALGKVEPSHEIAPQSLRTALLTLLARTPELNSGGYTGQVSRVRG